VRAGRLGDLFDLKYDRLPYDITSTFAGGDAHATVEGQCQGNPLAKRGYSRDSRPDCVQVCSGLVLTTAGIPLGYEVYAGNTSDATTSATLVKAMAAKYGQAERVWVLDRGMVSEKNLAFLRQRGGSYIVGTPKALLKQLEQHLTQADWPAVQAGVAVKLVPGPDGNETFILALDRTQVCQGLARSAARREKEKALHERFVERFEAGLTKLPRVAEKGVLREASSAHQRLGRLKERYGRAAGAFEVRVTPLDKPADTARLSSTWTRNERWKEWSARSVGCYLLRTNLTATDPARLWKRYLQLTAAEWAFRSTKDELALRPIWHHKDQRVKAHILAFGLPPWSPSAGPTSGGRRWRSGCAAPGWALPRARCSKRSPGSKAATCCSRRAAATVASTPSDCVASPPPTSRRKSS
jgi:transposase